MADERVIWSDEMVRAGGIGPAHPNHPKYDEYWDNGLATAANMQFNTDLETRLAQRKLARQALLRSTVELSTAVPRSAA